MKRLLLLVVIFTLLALPVFADPPFAPQIAGELNIVYPQNLYHPLNENINLSFDILDSSLLRLNDTQVDCALVSVNNRGEVVANGPLYYNTTYHYWKFPLNSTQSSTLGVYNFYVYCNTTTESGFVSLTYIITSNGLEEQEDYSQFSVMSILYFIFIIGLFITLGVVNKFSYFKWASLVFAFYQFILMLGYVYAIYSSLNIDWVFRFNLYITSIVGFLILMLSIMFRSIDLMGYGTESEKSQLGMDRFEGDKFSGGKQL